MTRIVRFLIPFSWTLWGILFLILSWAFFDSIINPVHTPDMSAQVGPLVVGFLLCLWAGAGLLLRWTARRRSTGCLIALALLLAYVVVMLVAMLSVEAWNAWQMGSTFTFTHLCGYQASATNQQM